MQRLKTRAQFQAVLAGATVARSEHFALHRCGLRPRDNQVAGVGSSELVAKVAPAESKLYPLFPVLDLWMGAMVPKRWAKRAVTRNAIKRQIYTVSADFSPKQGQAAFVVRLRRDFSRKVYLSATSDQLKKDVRAELETLMHEGARQS
ncbi:MAG: ribonuclease P protein component [Polaromonas sp.]|nr:ribonuclease P protein component [Polaromonas sp.]